MQNISEHWTPVNFGKHDVQFYKIRFVMLHQIQGIFTSFCYHDPGASLFCQKLDGHKNIRLIADYENFFYHYMVDLVPFEQMDAILKEIKRVLKKGGKLVLVNMTVGEKLGSGIYDILYQLSPRMMGGCRGIRLSKKLQGHGFDAKLREYYQQFLFPSEVILAKK